MDITQEEAAQYLMKTGSVVTIDVARQGALYHGLAPLLAQPSPHVDRPHLDPRIMQMNQIRMQPSKSVPSLNDHMHPHGPSPTHRFHPEVQFIRSRSTQNLHDGMVPVRGRVPTHPNEEPYQNVSFHQGAQDSRMGSTRGRPPMEDLRTSPARASQHRRHNGQPSPIGYYPPPQEDPRRQYGSSPSRGHTSPSHGYRPQQGPPQGRPKNYPPRMSPQYANSPTEPNHPDMHPEHQLRPFPDSGYRPPLMDHKNPPPTAPKPHKGGHSEGPEKPLKVPMAHLTEENYRESPPPPPPPTSTHPLIGSNTRTT